MTICYVLLANYTLASLLVDTKKPKKTPPQAKRTQLKTITLLTYLGLRTTQISLHFSPCLLYTRGPEAHSTGSTQIPGDASTF